MTKYIEQVKDKTMLIDYLNSMIAFSMVYKNYNDIGEKNSDISHNILYHKRRLL